MMPAATGKPSAAPVTVTAWSPGEDVIEVERTPGAGRRAQHLAHLPRDRCAA